MTRLTISSLPLFALMAACSANCNPPPSPDAAMLSHDASQPPMPAKRNVLQQPFASSSIWNTAIGSGARYAPAGIKLAPDGAGFKADENIIVLAPDAPLTDILVSDADWDNTRDRCVVTGGVLFAAPIPPDFVLRSDLPHTPNNGLAVLLPDRRTIKQTQPFVRCAAGGPATSHYLFNDVDLYGDGIHGAHGGSKLSALGGALRVGELRPGSGPIRHAIKLELWSKKYYSACKGRRSECFRWPAQQADSYAEDMYGGSNPALKPGALLAIPSSADITKLGLETAAALELARTLQDYGGYIVDDTAWNVASIAVERGPAGRFTDQFRADYGFDFSFDPGTNTAWSRDIQRLFTALQVVDNNTTTTIGGGGIPRQPPAPPVAP